MAGPLPDISHLLTDDPADTPSPAALSNISATAPVDSAAYNAAMSAEAQNAIRGGAPTYYKKNLPDISHLLTEAPNTSSSGVTESQDKPDVTPTPPEEYPDLTQEQSDALKLPDWGETPELQYPGFRATARLTSATGDDFKSILADNYPGLEVKDVGKGIIKVKSDTDGTWRVWRPGMQPSDIPRALYGTAAAVAGSAATAAALPEEIGGGIAGLLAKMAHGFGASAGVEGLKAAGGGTVNPWNLLTGAVAEPIVAGLGKFGQTVMDAWSGNTPAAGVVSAAPPTQRMVKTIADAAEGDVSAIGTLHREMNPNPRSVSAAQQLGIELHPDQTSSNPTFKAASQALKSSISSEAATAQQMSDRLAAQKIRDTAERWGVQFDQGGFSESLLNDMKRDIAADRAGSTQAYADIRQILPDSTKVNTPKEFLAFAKGRIEGLGGEAKAAKVVPELVEAVKALEDSPTQGLVNHYERKFRKTARGIPGGFADASKTIAEAAGTALKHDNMETAVKAGIGRELAAAQAGVAARKVKEDAFVHAFGIRASEELGTGSLVPKLNAGMQALQNQKDPVPIGKLMSAVPAPRRQEAALTAMSYAFGKPTPEKPIDFGSIVKFADALERDSAVRDAILPHLPAGFKQDWKAIVQVSRDITDTAKYVVKTGRVLDADTSGAGKLVANIVDTAAYWGGKPGVAARGVVNFVMKAAQEERKAAVNAYMTSPEFHGLVEKILAKEPIPMGFLERQAARPLFQRFAKAAQIPVSDGAKLLQKLIIVPAVVGSPLRAGATDYLENH